MSFTGHSHNSPRESAEQLPTSLLQCLETGGARTFAGMLCKPQLPSHALLEVFHNNLYKYAFNNEPQARGIGTSRRPMPM